MPSAVPSGSRRGERGQVSLGTRGSFGAYRWKNVNITGSVNNSSDARLKRCIEDLDVRDCWKRCGRAGLSCARTVRRRSGAGCFVAQEAHKALKTLDGEPVEFYDGEDPEHPEPVLYGTHRAPGGRISSTAGPNRQAGGEIVEIGGEILC